MVELINPNGILIDVAESKEKKKLAAGWKRAGSVEKSEPVVETPPAPKKKSSGKSGKKQASSVVEDSE